MPVIFIHSWLYTLFLALDANFHLSQKGVSTKECDPCLTQGCGYAHKGHCQEVMMKISPFINLRLISRLAQYLHLTWCGQQRWYEKHTRPCSDRIRYCWLHTAQHEAAKMASVTYKRAKGMVDVRHLSCILIDCAILDTWTWTISSIQASGTWQLSPLWFPMI